MTISAPLSVQSLGDFNSILLVWGCPNSATIREKRWILFDFVYSGSVSCSLVQFVQLSEVEKGRSIYAGIQKFVAFIMSVHIAEAREVAAAVWEEFEDSDVTIFTGFHPGHADLHLHCCGHPGSSALFLPSCYWLPVSHQL